MELIKEGLKDIKETLDGKTIAYTTLEQSGKDCSVLNVFPSLESYTHLQNLSLTFHSLIEMKSLSCLKWLITLNLSHNRITTIDLMSEGLHLLRSADVSHNDMTTLPRMDNLIKMTYLNASNNKISSLESFYGLPSLKTLDLSHNSLVTLRGMDSMPSLEKLDLSHNRIQVWAERMGDNQHDQSQMPKLKTLILHHNDLAGNSNGKPLRIFCSLEDLDVSTSKFNKDGRQNIRMLDVYPNLKDTLKSINFSETPLWTSLEEAGDARNNILLEWSFLTKLNGEDIEEEVRENIRNTLKEMEEKKANDKWKENIKTQALQNIKPIENNE